MLRKDLIMRQFEEFGKVLALILGFKRQGDWNSFEKEIQQAFKQFTPFEIEQVEKYTGSDFETEIINNKKLSFDEKKIMAALLFEKMNYYIQVMDEIKSAELKSRCTLLYQHLKDNFTENEFDLDVHYKLEFLKRKD